MAEVVSDSAVAELGSGLTGDVITPDHAAYEQARKVWNGAIDRRPALIVRPTTSGEVATTIGFALRHGLELAVRGGGHAYAGGSTCDDGLVLDLGAMRQVTVDPERRIARVGGGAQWGDVDAATQEHGLALTGGLISHTGVGGLTLGGGMGWLTRRAGLSLDSMLGAEMVTADGRILHASEGENSELFWGLRGGGGNFGVVTEFEFRLHGAGPLCQLGFFFWTADRGPDALRFARAYVAGLHEDFAPLIVGLSAPPAPFVPEHLHGKPGWALLVAGFGDPDAHAAAVQPVREAGPDVEFATPIPYVMLQQMLNEGNEHGLLAYEKALFMDELADGAIDVLSAALSERRSALSGIPIFVFGGAYARVADDATAFAGSRRAMFAVNAAGQAAPDDQDGFEHDRTWVRSIWERLVPYSLGTGSYVNFMSEYEEDRVRQAYGPAKYERLLRLKREYDPENVFHRMAANIKP